MSICMVSISLRETIKKEREENWVLGSELNVRGKLWVVYSVLYEKKDRMKKKGGGTIKTLCERGEGMKFPPRNSFFLKGGPDLKEWPSRGGKGGERGGDQDLGETGQNHFQQRKDSQIVVKWTRREDKRFQRKGRIERAILSLEGIWG